MRVDADNKITNAKGVRMKQSFLQEIVQQKKQYIHQEV